MKITITLRGTLKKYLNGHKELQVEVPDGCTCDEALQTIGINYKEIPSFGFVAINSMRYRIDHTKGIPVAFQGIPIYLVAAAVLAVVLTGFSTVAVGIFS